MGVDVRVGCEKKGVWRGVGREVRRRVWHGGEGVQSVYAVAMYEERGRGRGRKNDYTCVCIPTCTCMC